MTGGREVIQDPVVQGPMVFTIKGADGMGYFFNGIGNAVRKIVHGINAPGRSGPMVIGL
jgi:hypothetical protein